MRKAYFRCWHPWDMAPVARMRPRAMAPFSSRLVPFKMSSRNVIACPAVSRKSVAAKNEVIIGKSTRTFFQHISAHSDARYSRIMKKLRLHDGAHVTKQSARAIAVLVEYGVWGHWIDPNKVLANSRYLARLKIDRDFGVSEGIANMSDDGQVGARNGADNFESTRGGDLSRERAIDAVALKEGAHIFSRS
jgi:hypothetical protein